MLPGHFTGSPSYVFLDAPEEGAVAALLLPGDGIEGKLLRQPIRGTAEGSWHSLLLGIKDAEGFVPAFVCCTGDPGVIHAIRSVYPDVLIQVSLSHRLRTLGQELTPQGRNECLAECRRIFSASDRTAAVVRFRTWRDRWLSRGEGGVRTLERDLGWCLTFYRFPRELRRTVRSLRLLRRASRAARALEAPSPVYPPSPESELLDQGFSAVDGDRIIVHVDTILTDPTLAETLQQYRRNRLRVAQTAPAIASAIGLAARLLGRGH